MDPETTSCRWIDGGLGPTVGSRFRGKNRRGSFRWTTTTCTILVADPAAHLAFKVRYRPLPIFLGPRRCQGEAEPGGAGYRSLTGTGVVECGRHIPE
jgi:hypothetical protein